jgi:hypothetical protein
MLGPQPGMHEVQQLLRCRLRASGRPGAGAGRGGGFEQASLRMRKGLIS